MAMQVAPSSPPNSAAIPLPDLSNPPTSEDGWVLDDEGWWIREYGGAPAPAPAPATPPSLSLRKTDGKKPSSTSRPSSGPGPDSDFDFEPGREERSGAAAGAGRVKKAAASASGDPSSPEPSPPSSDRAPRYVARPSPPSSAPISPLAAGMASSTFQSEDSTVAEANAAGFKRAVSGKPKPSSSAKFVPIARDGRAKKMRRLRRIRRSFTSLTVSLSSKSESEIEWETERTRKEKAAGTGDGEDANTDSGLTKTSKVEKDACKRDGMEKERAGPKQSKDRKKQSGPKERKCGHGSENFRIPKKPKRSISNGDCDDIKILEKLKRRESDLSEEKVVGMALMDLFYGAKSSETATAAAAAAGPKVEQLRKGKKNIASKPECAEEEEKPHKFANVKLNIKIAKHEKREAEAKGELSALGRKDGNDGIEGNSAGKRRDAEQVLLTRLARRRDEKESGAGAREKIFAAPSQGDSRAQRSPPVPLKRRVKAVVAMGFSRILARKGLLHGGGTVTGAVEWILAHQKDFDIDNPIRFDPDATAAADASAVATAAAMSERDVLSPAALASPPPQRRAQQPAAASRGLGPTSEMLATRRRRPRFDIPLKQLHAPSDRVMACWMPTGAWYPAIVRSYTTAKKSGRYGETRSYDVLFEDGDADDHLADVFVMDPTEYELSIRHQLGELDGVMHKTLPASKDEWMKRRGWYETVYSGKKVFPTLVKAARACDDGRVRAMGRRVQRADLHLPDEWKFRRGMEPIRRNGMMEVENKGEGATAASANVTVRADWDEKQGRGLPLKKRKRVCPSGIGGVTVPTSTSTDTTANATAASTANTLVAVKEFNADGDGKDKDSDSVSSSDFDGDDSLSSPDDDDDDEDEGEGDEYFDDAATAHDHWDRQRAADADVADSSCDEF